MVVTTFSISTSYKLKQNHFYSVELKHLCPVVIHRPLMGRGIHEKKIENFNYLNVAFISYKLTMWDLMLFSVCHTRGQRLRKKDSSC